MNRLQNKRRTMKLIVISSPAPVPNEHSIINSLFEEGLEIFHIHKPTFSKEETEKFIRQIPAKYHNKIFLHSDFPKFHSMQEMENYKRKYEYAFLSPIFDSISKAGYKSKFYVHELKFKIEGKNIIALSGIDEEKIAFCRVLGFVGVAVLGALWNSKDSVEKFKRIKVKCQKKDLVS